MLKVNTNGAKGMAMPDMSGKYSSARSQRPPSAARNRLALPKSIISVPPYRRYRRKARYHPPCWRPRSVDPGESVPVPFQPSSHVPSRALLTSSVARAVDGRKPVNATKLRLPQRQVSPRRPDWHSPPAFQYLQRPVLLARRQAPCEKRPIGPWWL